MIFELSDFDRIKKYSFIMEEKTFAELQEYISSLSKQEFYLIWSFIFGSEIFGEISSHKIKLTEFLAKENNVKIMSEDATRIVFTIAMYYKSGFNAINKALENEVGSLFQLSESYNSNGRIVTWQTIAKRAFEIRNGIQNHAYLLVKDSVKEVMSYYKIDNHKDAEAIEKLLSLSLEILKVFVLKKDFSFKDAESKDLFVKIEHFYSMTNHLKMDIESLKNEESYDKVLTYIVNMRNVFQAKLHLINQKMPLNDYTAAQNFIIKNMARKEMDRYLSLEEINRLGIKLDRLQPSQPKA
ncbi:MAG: hypothetical protein WC536_01900 [Patescibacteria group bacterium]|jgi:hypothetical protein